MLLSIQEVLKRHNLSSADFEAANVDQFLLEQIYEHHESRRPELEHAAAFLAREVASIPGVHDVAFRVKSGDGLVAKIIRKRRDDSARDFTLKTYASQMTDLIGVRAMHLEKRGWRSIHASLSDGFRHRNPPEANVAAWEETEVAEWFRDAGLEVRRSENGYRSIHYVVEVPNTGGALLAEVQLRTMFENSWGEIDHDIRYPSRQVNAQIEERLVELSRLGGKADLQTSAIYEPAAPQADLPASFPIVVRLAVPPTSTGADAPARGHELIDRALARAEEANVHRAVVDLTADEPIIEIVLGGKWYLEDQLEIRFDFLDESSEDASMERVLELFGPNGRRWFEPGQNLRTMLWMLPSRLRADIPAFEPYAWLEGSGGGRAGAISEYHERHAATGRPAITVLLSERFATGEHPFVRPEQMRLLLLELDQSQLYRHNGEDGYAVMVPIEPREGAADRATYVGLRDIEPLVRMGYLRAVPRPLVRVDNMPEEFVLSFERTDKGDRFARRERRRHLPSDKLSVFVLLCARVGATEVDVHFHLGVEEPDPEFLLGSALDDADVTRINRFDEPDDLRCDRLLIAPRELSADLGV